MAKTMLEGAFALTVEDQDCLPAGTTADDVRASLVEALERAAAAWHQENQRLVRDVPVVY